ncbi:MAG: ATP-binding protein, partial [Dehalococcoidia bacterium]
MNSGDHKVTVKELRWQCDPGVFKFDCTKDIAPLQEFIGQNRAIRAIEFGLSVDKPGYNIFVTGLTGTGRASAIKSHLEGLIKSKGALGILPIPNDWCYIHNFTDPDKPQIVQLPKGKGKALKNQMEELLKALKSEIAKVFSGEEYESESKRTMEEGQEKHRQLLQQLEKEAKEEGFTIQPSPMGVILIPLIDDKPATQAQYATLKEEEKEAIEAKRAEFMKRVNETLEKAQSLQKDTKERIKDLDRRVGGFAIEKLINELLKDYTDSPDIVRYLENIRSFTLDNIPLFRDQDTSPSPQPPAQVIPIPKERDIFLPFQVNVYVDNIESTGPPIVIESNPTFGNIFGKIDRRFIMGAFVTDHTMLKAGALSLANGGYLVLNARDVLITPGVWEAIKRAIKNKEVSLEDPVEQFGLIAPHGLKPQPMPIDVKVMLTGDNLIYRLLSAYDEDFWEVFKVKADFDNQIERTPENLEAYSGFICACCEREGLRHFHRSGVAKVLEHAVRMVGDQEKLSTRFGLIKDILIEADYWAQKEDSELVNGEHVKKAIDEKIYRSNLISERINELIVDGTIMVDVKGAVAGQINGLSVYDLGDFSFGKPSRITARIYMGRSGVINIERESQLSGKIHDKGVLILTGYLGWKH